MPVIYMEVTKDRFEFPVAVAGSMSELARMRGVDISTIWHSLNRKIDPRRRHKYVRVDLDETEDEEATIT